LIGKTSVAQRIFSHSPASNGNVGANIVFGVFKKTARFSLTHPRALQKPRNALSLSSFFNEVIGAIFHVLRYALKSSTEICFSSFLPKKSPISLNMSLYLFVVSTARWRLFASSMNRAPASSTSNVSTLAASAVSHSRIVPWAFSQFEMFSDLRRCSPQSTHHPEAA